MRQNTCPFVSPCCSTDGRALMVGTRIVAYANKSGKAYVIPEIGMESFWGCGELESVGIGANIEIIGQCAFAN